MHPTHFFTGYLDNNSRSCANECKNMKMGGELTNTEF